MKKFNGAKVLYLDVETSPILALLWKLFNNDNVSLGQLQRDRSILAYAYMWEHEQKVYYRDQRNKKDFLNDKEFLTDIYNAIAEADVIITQNGNSFDLPILFGRFLVNGFAPVGDNVKKVDIYREGKKKFNFISHKLEYMANVLNAEYKKLSHKKYPGLELWINCMANVLEAWKEMELYNKHDVLTLRAVYKKMEPWISTYNPNLYTDNNDLVCVCGSTKFTKKGFRYTSVGKYQMHKCVKCGKRQVDRKNLFDKEKKESLKK